LKPEDRAPWPRFSIEYIGIKSAKGHCTYAVTGRPEMALLTDGGPQNKGGYWDPPLHDSMDRTRDKTHQ